MPSRMHVISHTHWDREWYQTFQQFRLRLVDLVDHLLDILETDPDFLHFNLDAQTIVLEDYLQVRPEARERLEKHIRSGQITIGPWYQLNDEFLTSGESTVRSLLIGHRVARSFGAVMKIGYLPDQFGNLGQMPQIFQGFGIDNAIMGRGYQLADDRKMEFKWVAPDGSCVVASLMAYWYNNAQYIPEDGDGALKAVASLRDVMAANSAIGDLLFMNGVDHLEAIPHIGRTVKAVNARLQADGVGDEIFHSTLPAYIDALREAATAVPLATVSGELREDRHGACLAGVLSTRVYLKQANHASEQSLERYAEPLSAFARIHGAAYPQDQLRYAWKLLMQNHPHDSICGCSIDQVHDEMMPRFDQVIQVADFFTERAMDTLGGRDRTKGATDEADRLLIFNTLNWERTDPVTVTLEFPLGGFTRGNPPKDAARVVHGIALLDPDGAEVPFGITATETVIATVSNPLDLPLDQWVQRITVEFVAEGVPACGYKEYRIERRPSMPAYPPVEQPGPADLYYDDPALEDGGDIGDEYLYRAPLNDQKLEDCLACRKSWAIQQTPVRSTATTLADGLIPRSTAAEGRSADLVACPVEHKRTVWAGVPRAEYTLTVDNKATDHRLRVVFEASSGETVTAASAYDAVVRPNRAQHEAMGASPFHPMLLWVDTAADGDDERSEQGRTLIAPGLYEYEVYEHGQGDGSYRSLAVTLLRCVGQLSGRGDGPGIQTPGGQCPGKHTFRIALFPHAGDWKAGKVWKQAHQFATPLKPLQCPAADRPACRTYVEVGPDQLILSALKRAEDRDTLIIRFFNTTDEDVAEATCRVPGAKRLRVVNLDEEPQGEWTAGDSLSLPVGAKKIITVEAEV